MTTVMAATSEAHTVCVRLETEPALRVRDLVFFEDFAIVTCTSAVKCDRAGGREARRVCAGEGSPHESAAIGGACVSDDTRLTIHRSTIL